MATAPRGGWRRAGARLTLWLTLAISLSGALAAPAGAWRPEPATYGVGAPQELRVTMSDGAHLMADLYYPTDPRTGAPAAGRFPVVLSQTPYGKRSALTTKSNTSEFGGDGYYPYLVARGYINAIVDVRGSGSSEGDFQLFGPREIRDGVELVRWAAGLPRSSGRVGGAGSSYVGINQLLTAAEVGPGSPLKAIFPVDAGNDLYRDLTFSGGIPNTEFALVFAALRAGMVSALPDSPGSDPGRVVANPIQRAAGYSTLDASLYSEVDTNGPRAFEQSFWYQRSPGRYLAQIVANQVPAFLVGGWFDVYQRGEPLNYAALQNAAALAGARAGPGRPQSDRRTTAGRRAGRRPPAGKRRRRSGRRTGGRHASARHGGRPPAPAAPPRPTTPLPASVDSPMVAGQPVSGRYQLAEGPWFHDPTALGQRFQELQLQWFDRWLKGEPNGIDQTRTPLHLYELGARRWVQASTYPLAAAHVRTLWLGPGSGPGAGGSLTDRPPTARGASEQLAFNGQNSPCSRGVDQWSTGLVTYATALAGTPPFACDGDDRSTQAGSLVFTSSPLAAPATVAGPLNATIYLSSTTRDAELVATAQDVAPDGSSRPLSQGALLGSLAAVDQAASWKLDGRVVLPYHPYTAVSRRELTPGTSVPLQVEIYPTFARLEAGHRLRLTLSSGAAGLEPTPAQLPALIGGVYSIQLTPWAPSHVDVPLARPTSLASSDTTYGPCNGGC